MKKHRLSFLAWKSNRELFSRLQLGISKIFLLSVLCLGFVSFSMAQSSFTFNSGSVIINMSGGRYAKGATMNIANSSVANSLKPYGLMYAILKGNNKIPIYGIIRKGKLNDEFDFDAKVNGRDSSYGGGSYIIPQEFVSQVQSLINTWRAKGVLISYISQPLSFSTSSYDIRKFTYAPKWAISNLSDNKTDAFFINSEIPTSSYAVKEVVNSSATPDLDKCDDIILFPHYSSDLTYAKLSPLLNWNKNYKGALWGGCHSNYVLDGVFSSVTGKYVLSTAGIEKYDSPKYPYKYDLIADDPVAQYIGKSISNDVGGNTQAYELLSGSAWRTSSKVITQDASSTRRSVNIYGRAFGESDRGFAFWQAGHIDGTKDVDIVGQRMFFNYSFFVANEKLGAYIPNSEIILTDPNGAPVQSGDQIDLSVGSYTGSETLSYSWTVSPTSTTIGSFVSSTTNRSVTYKVDCGVSTNTTLVFQVTVTDGCGRSTFETKSVDIQPNVLSSSISKTNVSCNGESTGAIDLTVTGGTVTKTYAWTGPNGFTSGLQDIDGLAAGTYNLTVTDANSCQITRTYQVTQPVNPFTATITSTASVICEGESIVLTVPGTEGKTWVWSSGELTQSINVSPVTSTIYTVTVTNDVGCTATASISITVNPLPPLPIVADVSRDGSGTLTLTATPTLAGIELDWYETSSGGSSVATSTNSYTTPELSSTQDYYVQSRYTTTGCLSSSREKITAEINGTINPGTISGDQSYCETATATTITSTGDASVSPSSPITYKWYSSTDEGVTYNIITGANSTTYEPGTVTETTWFKREASADVNGEPKVGETDPVKVTINSVPTLTLTVTDSKCFDGTTGSIASTVSGGATPYGYLWSNGQSTSEATNLSAGTYSLTVTDKNGCIVSSSTTVNQPAEVVILTVSKTLYNGAQLKCSTSSEGILTVSATGGTGTFTYTYSKDGGAPVSKNSGTLDGLGAGDYEITVTDANGCESTSTITTITPPSSITISSTQTDVTCFNGENGAIDLSVSGGTGTITYNWSGPGSYSADSKNLSSLLAGTYTVTVTDGNDCTASAAVEIIRPDLIEITLVSKKLYNNVELTCFGDEDGEITVAAEGGSGGYTYIISKEDGSTDSNNEGLFNLLGAGTYTLTVTDVNNCTSVSTVTTITAPSLVSIATVSKTLYNGAELSCAYTKDGELTITANGGTGIYIFDYSMSDGTSASNSVGIFGGLGAGTYTITVSDQNGCSATTSTTITKPAAVSITGAFEPIQPNCEVATGSISLTTSLSDLIFTLTGSSGTATNTVGLFDKLAAGTYTLTATNSITGCVSPEETFLVNPQPTAASVSVSKTDILCNGDKTGAVSLTISGGIAPYAYNWSNGETSDEVLGVGAGTYTITGLSAGTFTITVTENGGGCTTTATTTINQPDFALSGTFTPTNISCKGGNTGSLDLTAAGGTGPYTYAWLGPDSFISDKEDLTGLFAGNYTVTITDANKCTAVVTETVNEPGSAYSATISSTASTICADGSVTLTASSGSSYLWSNSSTNQSITVSPTSSTSYTVTVTSADNCTAQATYSVTVNALPTITTSLSSVCVSKTLDLESSDDGGTWSTASSTIATVDATGIVTGIAEGTVTITYRNDNGCTVEKLITVNPLPTVLSVSNASKSGTGSLTLSATPSEGATINWYENPDDAIASALATSTTTYITNVISSTTNYHVEAVNTTTGCVSASRQTVLATIAGTVNPGDISSAQTFCGPGDPDMLISLQPKGDASIDVDVPISYQWYSSIDSLTYVKVDQATSTTYDPGLLSVTTWYKREASAVVDGKTTSAFSNPIKITINPVVALPVITATSSTTFCEGGSVELTATTSTASVTYQWSLNGININGADHQTYTADSSGGYRVQVTSAVTGCSATSTPSFTVVENPLPNVPTINWRAGDTTTFCKGDTIVLSSSEIASVYRWYEGVSTTPLNTDLTSSSFTVTTSGSYKLEIENEFGCVRQSSSPVVVTVNALPVVPTITASGTLDFCPGDSVQLSSSSAASHQWYLNGGLISGATQNKLLVKTAGAYSLVVTDANSCSSSTASPTMVTVYSAPAKPAVTASGNTTFCKGDSVILSTTGTGSFHWFKDGVKLKDSTRSKLVVDSAGSYTVQVTSINGCLSEKSDAVNIVTNDIPSFTVSIAPCKGKVIKLTGSPTAAALNPWISSNPVVASIDFNGNLTANEKGKVNITYTNSNGCSITREIDINVAPALPDSITGPGLVTPGSTILFTVPPSSGSTTYAWSFPSGWTASSSDNIATATPNGKSGNVAVVASENGCTSDTVIFLVTVDSTDTDKDGIYDLLDLDNDNDGILDQIEYSACTPASVTCDTDGDGTPNRFDLDSDADGITDVYEGNGTDVDKDGIADGPVDADGVPISANGGLAPPDTDKDGNLDPYDVDSDNDGIPDSTEAGSDPKTPRDTDKDGIPDFRELDSDNDGIPDSTEAGSDPTMPRDTDGDGYADYIDLDSDNDGIRDKVENGNGPSELDTDRDKIPDYLDLDSDADGITDVVESDGTDANKDGRSDGASDSNGIPASANGGVTPPDTDRDGKRDFQDVDSDGDGIPDNIEGQDTYITFKGKDSDKDGLDDAYDNDGGNYISPVDTDKDAKPDYRDLDSDMDGIPDIVEKGPDGNNPRNTDGVDKPDYRDKDSDNDTIPDVVEAVDGDTNPASPVDTDNDGLPDYRDLDSEEDTIPDMDEAGPNPDEPVNTDGTDKPDFRDADSNNNEIPDGETLLIWKKATTPKLHSPAGEMEITFTIILTNQRPEPLTEVQIKENLNVTFPSPITFRIGSVVSNGVLRPSSSFNGTTNINMLQSGITLQGYQQDSIMFTVIFNPNNYLGDIKNMAEGAAVTKWGPVTRYSIDIVNSNGRKHGPGDVTESPIPLVDFVLPDVITPNGDGFNDKLVIQRPAGVKAKLMVFNRWGQSVYENADYQNDWDGKITKGSRSTDLVQSTYYYIVEFTGSRIVGKTVRKSYLTIKRNY